MSSSASDFQNISSHSVEHSLNEESEESTLQEDSPLGPSAVESSAAKSLGDRSNSVIPVPLDINSKILNSFFSRVAIPDIDYKLPQPSDRCHLPPEGFTALSTAVLDIGVGLPLHSFFCDVLNSYGVAPFQLAPVGWCYLVGTLFLFLDAGLGLPSLREMHYLYRLVNYKHEYYWFLKNWAIRRPHFHVDFYDPYMWKRQYFFLGLDRSNPELKRCLGDPSMIDRRPPLSPKEKERIDRVYSRCQFFDKIRGGRSINGDSIRDSTGNVTPLPASWGGRSINRDSIRDSTGNVGPLPASLSRLLSVDTACLEAAARLKTQKRKGLTDSPGSGTPPPLKKVSTEAHATTSISTRGNEVESALPSGAVRSLPLSSVPAEMAARRIDLYLKEQRNALIGPIPDAASPLSGRLAEIGRRRAELAVDEFFLQKDMVRAIDLELKGLRAKLAASEKSLLEAIEASKAAKVELEVAKQSAQSQKLQLDAARRSLAQEQEKCAQVEVERSRLEAALKEADEKLREAQEKLDRVEGASGSWEEDLDWPSLVKCDGFAPIKEALEDLIIEKVRTKIQSVYPQLDLSFLAPVAGEDSVEASADD